MVDMAYECGCGARYSKGIYRALIAGRKHKFVKCACGRKLKPENSKISKGSEPDMSCPVNKIQKGSVE